MVNIGWCQPWNSLLFSFEKNRRRRSLKSRKHGECINTFQLSGKLSTFNRSLLPIFSLFSIPLFIILFSAFPWLYIFWVGVGPICRLFFYQFTGVGQSANTLCTVTYTHFVHIIGLPPPPPILPYTNGPILAAIHVQWRAEKTKKTKKEKKKKEKKRELLPFLVANDEEKWVGKEPVDIVGWFRMCRTKQTHQTGPGKHGQRNDEGLSPCLVGRSLIYLVYWSVFFSPTSVTDNRLGDR